MADPGQRLPVVHIGMPKTATKTLQWRLFALHSDIYYLGRYDGRPFKGKYQRYLGCRDADVFRVMEHVAYQGVFDADVDSCRQHLDAYLQQHNGEGKLPVWSWESYGTDSFEMRSRRAQNLRQLLGQAKILVGIRHPVGLLESAYMQQLKRDNIGGYAHWGKRCFFPSFTEWFERNHRGDIDNHLDYPRTIRTYAELFGEQNVYVAVFEELREAPERFWGKICEFMGVDSREALELVAGNADNTRWTEIQLQRLGTIHDSSLRSLAFRLSGKRRRKSLLDLRPNESPGTKAARAKPDISPATRADIVRRTSEGNRWLQQAFGLELDRWGYLSQ